MTAVLSWGAEQPLYQADIPVSSRDKAQYQQAVSLALRQVLIKLTGNPSILTLPAFEESLLDPQRLVDQYSYMHATSSTSYANQTTLLLRVKFDEKAINQLLEQQGQPIIGTDRPAIVLWLVAPEWMSTANKGSNTNNLSNKNVQPTHRSVLVNSDTNPQLSLLLQQDAEQRGLPVIFPMLDLEDFTHVSPEDIAGPDMAQIIQASQRYGSNAMVVASFQLVSNKQWIGQWRFIWLDKQYQWQIQADQLESVIAQGMDHVASAMAQQYLALKKGDEQHAESLVALTIDDVTTVDQNQILLNYLQQLSGAQHVRIVSVANNQVTYQLQISGGKEALAKLLEANQQLVPEIDSFQTALNNELKYQLIMDASHA
ncbi:MAG: DUF2066 domain-containing protein [Gammaproteobacteria bacterium]